MSRRSVIGRSEMCSCGVRSRAHENAWKIKGTTRGVARGSYANNSGCPYRCTEEPLWARMGNDHAVNAGTWGAFAPSNGETLAILFRRNKPRDGLCLTFN